MRVYVANVSIPVSTLPTAPVVVEINPNERHVVNCEVTVEAGAALLVAVRATDRGSLFWPAKGSRPEWVTAPGGETVSHRIHWRLSGSDFLIRIEFTNADPANVRVAEVRITVDDYPLEEIQLRILQKLDTLYRYLQATTDDRTVEQGPGQPRITRETPQRKIG